MFRLLSRLRILRMSLMRSRVSSSSLRLISRFSRLSLMIRLMRFRVMRVCPISRLRMFPLGSRLSVRCSRRLSVRLLRRRLFRRIIMLLRVMLMLVILILM